MSNVRPIYETSQDRSIEREIADAFALVNGLTARKLPVQPYRIDFAFTRAGTDRIVAFAECKCRHHPSNRYATVMLALSKWHALISLRRMSTGGSFFIVRFDDGDFALSVDAGSVDSVRWSGRTDRNDPADMEPCVHLRRDHFMRV